MRLSKRNTSICTFTLVKHQRQRTMWKLHIYYHITSCILNKVVKMEKVEKGLGRTTETLLAFYKQAALQQWKCFICKEANYRSVKVKIIPAETFLHWEADSQKWKYPLRTCEFDISGGTQVSLGFFLVPRQYAWQRPKMPGLLVPSYLTELFYSGCWISQAF